MKDAELNIRVNMNSMSSGRTLNGIERKNNDEYK